MSNELAIYNAARKALAQLKRVDEVKAIRDKAAAVRVYAKHINDAEMLDDATDLLFRAELRAGELLLDMAARKERQRPGDADGRRPRPSLPKLSDLGVTKSQSSRWQLFASLSVEEREEKIARAKRKARAALDGTAKLEREELRREDEARVRALVPLPGQFRTLVIDPPWDYGTLSIAGRAAPGYAVMTREELLDLDVAQWAAENCHLYLWTTNNFLTRAVELMARWGFAHKTVLTWVKPRWGLGSYFRNSTEHVLFGVRGELRTRSDSIATHFEAPLGEHSEKPETFYDIVREASYEPYGECFQRTERADFTNVFAVKAEAAE